MAPPKPAAETLAPRPMEMILAGTGGCTAFDVVLILKKAATRSAAARSDSKPGAPLATPRCFTHIHFHFTVRGKQLKPEAVARAIELSKDKYCSASIMLGKTAEITHDFEIVEES